MDVEVMNESAYSHVLEVLPAEDGKSDTEVKAVTIAPFLGRHLYEHQVCEAGVVFSGMRRDSFICGACVRVIRVLYRNFKAECLEKKRSWQCVVMLSCEDNFGKRNEQQVIW